MAEEQKQNFNWPPLESNPEVFTEYLRKIGLSDKWAIGEVFGFDEELLAFLPQPINGVIVAIERLKREEDVDKGSADNNNKVNFYMKQTHVLDNACGIIACLHAVLNNSDTVGLNDGSILANWADGAKPKSPEERAALLENADEFKQAHAAAAQEGQTGMSENQAAVKHHFVAYVVNANK